MILINESLVLHLFIFFKTTGILFLLESNGQIIKSMIMNKA